MGKDTVVIRSVVPSTIKQPFLSMPNKVKVYFCKNYGECDTVYYTSSYQGQQTRYVVVLQFDKGDIANRIKQKYNGRPLSGARVTTCWLDNKNMNELGITEDMISSESSKTKGDSYGRAGGKQTWMGRYHGSGKRTSLRDRGSSSSFRYGRETSRSPSPASNYKTQASGHLEVVSSIHSSTKTEVSESQEHPSSSGYSLRSGDSQERPSSQTSDHSSQSGVTEESTERSLSQNSHGSRDSVSDRKRRLTSSEMRSSSRLCARRRYESDSDDNSSKERDSNRKSKSSKYDSKNGVHSSRYSRRKDKHTSKWTSGQFGDKSSESDSKERDREERDRRERWIRYHRSRRSRESPRRRREQSDDEKQAQQYDTSESDVQIIATVTQSPKPENHLSVQPQVNQGAGVKMHVETHLDEVTSQTQPMDLDTSLNDSPELQENDQPTESQTTIKEEIQPERKTKAQQDSDQMDSHVDDQLESVLDTQQLKHQAQSLTVPSNPPASVFDFERDETPPAEIVEATAEWYRTQNVPPNFDSIPLQHLIHYYQSSMTAGRNKNEDVAWHNPSWPANSLQHQGDQQQEQTEAAASPYYTSPASNQSASTSTLNASTAQNLSITTEHSTATLEPHPSPKSTMTNISEDTDDTCFPTVQLGVHGIEPKTHNDGRDSNKWSDIEVRHQLQIFLNKAKSRAEEYSSISKPTPGSHLPVKGGTVPFPADMLESSRESGSDLLSTGRWFQQKKSSKEFSPYSDLKSRKPYHDTDEQTYQNVYSSSQNRDRAYSRIGGSSHTFVEHPTHEGYDEQMKCKESSKPSSSYPLEQEIPERIRATYPHNRPPSTQHIPPPLEKATASVFERDTDHRSEPRELYVIAPGRIQGQWVEHEKLGERSRDENWREREMWSMESVPLRKNDVGECMETSASSASRIQESDPSWGDEVRRRSREILMTPLVGADQLVFPNQPFSTTPYGVYKPSPCDKAFQTSQLQYSSQPLRRDHLFQNYPPNQVDSELEHHTELSGEDCNIVRAENTNLMVVHERVVDQLPAPRNQIEQKEFQEMLDRELEERALEEEKAKCREQAQEKDNPNYVYNTLEKEKAQNVITELSQDAPSADGDTEGIIQSSAVEDDNQHDVTKEVQTTLTTKKQLSRKYKQLQKSYYKEFCEQASILTESTKLLVCQNPDSKDVLMTSLQSSLEKLSLHLKDKFWYQVELGVE